MVRPYGVIMSQNIPALIYGCRFKYITTSAKGVHVPNLIKIDSAVAALRMRETNWFWCGFFVNI